MSKTDENYMDLKYYLKKYARMLKAFLEQKFPTYDWAPVNIMAENMYSVGIDIWQWNYVFLACDNCEGDDMEISTWEEYSSEENDFDPEEYELITEDWYRQLYNLYESFRHNQSKEEITLVCELISAMPQMITIGFDWYWQKNPEMLELVGRLEALIDVTGKSTVG